MYKQLSREQRYAIYLGIQEGKSQKAIARQNNIHPSTVSREVRRNSTKRGEYQWQHAQKLSDERRERLPGNHAVRPDVMPGSLTASGKRGLVTQTDIRVAVAQRHDRLP